MTIVVNGDTRSVRDGLTLEHLVRELGLDGKPIAIERNREVVARTLFNQTELREGDRLEIVSLVGGG